MVRALALAIGIAVVAGGCPVAGAASCLGAGPGAEAARIASVEPRLELRLADGRLLRLVGLDPATDTPTRPDLAETSRAGFAASLAGRDVEVRVMASTPDRWGRLPAVVAAPDAADGGLAAEAIAAGYGRYLAEPAARDCREALLAAEAQARAARRGLWDDPYDSVLDVDDRAGFTERAGTNIVVEGRLTEVQPGPYRTTLRFAATDQDSSHGHRLVATIVPRVMKSFETRQMDPRTLVGQRLRLRGLLDLRFGPRIELAGPDAVEVVAAATATPAAPMAGK